MIDEQVDRMTDGPEIRTPTASRPGPWAALRIRTMALPAWSRVWSLNLVLGAIALAIYALVLRDIPAPVGGFAIPWPLIAIGVAAAELKVVQVHFSRETHSFSLSEFPAVIGMFFLSPTEYLVAVLVGASAAFALGQRMRAIKWVFNLANFALVAAVSLTILHTVAQLDGIPGPQAWLGAFLATFTATVIAAVAIATVITLSGGAPQFEKLPEMIRFGSMVAFANTSLALLAVTIMKLDPMLLWLLVLPLLIVFVAYQAYVSEREKHERLELLYQSSRILQHSPEMDSALAALLSHARLMFRAELAEIVLYSRSDDTDALRTSSWHDGREDVMVALPGAAELPLHGRVRAASGPFFHQEAEAGIRHAMVSPLRGESSLVGSFMIANRLTEGTTFSDDDLRLFETLANQAAVALENGHLEQSLAELSRLKERLRHQAYHDELTGLPNRSLFVERVEERLAFKRPDGRMPVVLFLDLDDFKVVNDTLGHAAGDRLLAEVAARLKSVLRSDDVAARLGGDEFAVLLEDESDLTHAMSVAARIIDALKIAFLLEGTEIQIGGSIGVAAARLGTEVADELLRNADVAMYTAKESGKNHAEVFEPTMHAAIVARHELSAELSRSLGRGELVVLYQPIIDLKSGAPTGVEALLRWRHPVRGLIEPGEFIPLAEETGVIVPLGQWVLTEACRQAAGWNSRMPSGRGIYMAVNLSAQQLQESTFVADLVELLAETGLAPTQLVLEMTESVMFHDTSTTLANLQAIRGLGVRVAIDDFGTGYSSLGYLRRFPVDILKIAREFIGHADSTAEWSFAAAIVALGRALSVTIVAEGIEEAGQLERLRGLGCELGQGYLFARALEGEEAGLFLGINAATEGVDARGPSRAGARVRGAAVADGLALSPGNV